MDLKSVKLKPLEFIAYQTFLIEGYRVKDLTIKDKIIKDFDIIGCRTEGLHTGAAKNILYFLTSLDTLEPKAFKLKPLDLNVLRLKAFFFNL